MSYRRLLTIALIAGLPAVSQAQFTTFIAPKPKVVDSVKTVTLAKPVAAAAQKAEADSAVKTQLTNMKTWVDSAAGLAPEPASSAASDSVVTVTTPAPAPRPTMRTAPRITAADSLAFRNGARAPSTATNLPMFLVLGGLMVFAGATLVGAKPKPERVRGDRANAARRSHH